MDASSSRSYGSDVGVYGGRMKLLLAADKIQELGQFETGTWPSRPRTPAYQLCRRVCARLVETKTEAEMMAYFYRQIFVHSQIYREKAERDAEWEQFDCMARRGGASHERLRREMDRAAQHWGQELVEYYAKNRGVSFAIMLGRLFGHYGVHMPHTSPRQTRTNKVHSWSAHARTPRHEVHLQPQVHK